MNVKDLAFPSVSRVDLGDCVSGYVDGDCLLVNIHSDCRTIESFYKEIKSALSFPDYFGGNLSALRDCLNDGDIVSSHCLCLVIHGGNFLADDFPDVMDGLIDTLSLVGDDWASGGGWPWNFPPRSFHAVIQVEEGDQRFENLPRLAPQQEPLR